MRKIKLSSQHLAELKASGLSNSTIQKAGLYTEKDFATICSMLNCNGKPKFNSDNSALVFPFNYDGFVRLKLSNPRLRNGKPIKYESPFGSIQHPYFPPNTFEAITSTNDKDIVIVEGEKKALKLWQDLKGSGLNIFVIGITGVYGWKKSKKEMLVDWLESIPWCNRLVYLCFDNDVHFNRNVLDARKRLAKILRNKGANVKAVDIPISDPTKHYGVDDYIVQYGIEAYLDCFANAKDIDTKGILNLNVLSAADFETKPVEWLWNLYIPRGEITILDGNPGLGKSQIVADLAARVSKGFAMPPFEIDKPIEQPANVMLLCAEDTIEKTVKPRLQVCNANMHNIYFLQSKGKPLTFPNDIERFEQECLELEIGFVAIDPVMSYIGRDIDTHSDQSAREVLNRLKEFAEHSNIAILLLRHLNKRQGDAAIYRGGGSIAFTASSRCNLVVGVHPTEEDVNVLACIKSNLERKPKSISYTIESVLTSYGSIGKVEWLDEVLLKADDIVDIDKSSKKGLNKVDKCVELIKEQLTKNGPMLSLDLQNQVISLGKVSATTFQHARKKANLIRTRNPRERQLGKWWTKLPGQTLPWEQKKKTPLR